MIVLQKCKLIRIIHVNDVHMSKNRPPSVRHLRARVVSPCPLAKHVLYNTECSVTPTRLRAARRMDRSMVASFFCVILLGPCFAEYESSLYYLLVCLQNIILFRETLLLNVVVSKALFRVVSREGILGVRSLVSVIGHWSLGISCLKMNE